MREEYIISVVGVVADYQIFYNRSVKLWILDYTDPVIPGRIKRVWYNTLIEAKRAIYFLEGNARKLHMGDPKPVRIKFYDAELIDV